MISVSLSCKNLVNFFVCALPQHDVLWVKAFHEVMSQSLVSRRILDQGSTFGYVNFASKTQDNKLDQSGKSRMVGFCPKQINCPLVDITKYQGES